MPHRETIRIGPLSLDFVPDGQDSGVGTIRLATKSGVYAETTDDVPLTEWGEAVHAIHEAIRTIAPQHRGAPDIQIIFDGEIPC